MTTVFKESKAQRQTVWFLKGKKCTSLCFCPLGNNDPLQSVLASTETWFYLQFFKGSSPLTSFCHCISSVFPIWILWKIPRFSDLSIICLFIYFSKYKILTLNFRKDQSLAFIKGMMIKEFIEEFWKLELSTGTFTVYACSKELVFRQTTCAELT